jgi:inner membrane protein
MLAVDRAWSRGRRPPANFRGLLLLSYAGLWLHVFMDWLNSYGIRLLKPFSDRWFYGDALYIIDPILYVLFGAAIVLARRAERRGDAQPTRLARAGLLLAAVYVLLMLASNWWARAEVRSGLERAGRGDQRFMVTPVLGNPFRREVIVDMGDRYEKGLLWFEPLPHFRPAGYGVQVNASDPAAQQAAATPRFQAFLMWSRFPFFVVERTRLGTVVVINDYRYSGPSGRDGWATQSHELPAGQ